MKYKIKDESGDIVAAVKNPVDAGHVYRVYGSDHKITSTYRRVLYPLAEDHPDYDTPNLIAARIIDRDHGYQKKSASTKKVGTKAGPIKRYEVGPSWMEQKQTRWQSEHASMEIRENPAITQQ